ncbi:Fic/DOC family protein [Aquimarina sp. MAR_2010_214]|uniref:Fic family protein n=1 Tax=Aquimarina sp. MAR_2010_214 TaxID=1250026 RepID=UPI000C7156DE|nr:Fic family protein [Aquimarina sp. MAR_2010_214]PKV51909.1 Fic/DOC family protein [Aquimarina sp. MAR_2010_214]
MNELKNILDEYNKLIEGDTFDYQRFNQYAIVHHSNAIEGSTLTKEETFLLLDEQLTPNTKPLEYTLMALDHLEALKYVFELSFNHKPLSIEILQNLSALVMKNTGSEISSIAGDFNSSKGDFRKLTVRAGTRTFMDYQKVPRHVESLINQVNSEITKTKTIEDVFNLSFDAHYQLVTIHPFADGNGRVSRLLMNYIQGYHQMPLSVVFQEDKNEYYKALEETRINEDISIFRGFMLDQTKKHLLQEIETLSDSPKSSQKGNKGISFLF